VKYAFIRDNATDEVSIARFCRVLEVSRSGYYEWKSRGESNRSRIRQVLGDLIQAIHDKSMKAYGSPRVYQTLKRGGTRVGKSTVEKLMRERRLRSTYHRRFRPQTTDSRGTAAPAPNLLAQDFTAQRPNEKWVTDITYVSTAEGWLYLCVFLDLYSRKVVGYAMSRSLDSGLVCEAFRAATARRGVPKGLLLHSDRGCQYASEVFRQQSNVSGLVRSMSRVGNCYDNAVVESFFKTLKVEHIYQQHFESRAEAARSIVRWIEGFYNSERIHSSLGYLSPVEFEENSKAVA
jgi:hypothetical protein